MSTTRVTLQSFFRTVLFRPFTEFSAACMRLTNLATHHISAQAWLNTVRIVGLLHRDLWHPQLTDGVLGRQLTAFHLGQVYTINQMKWQSGLHWGHSY